MTNAEPIDPTIAAEPVTFDRSALAIVAGLTYTQRSQVFNRWLAPAYQVSTRWTGNRFDAEDATTWVLLKEMERLDLPEVVHVVDERIAESMLEAVCRHWSERYGISPIRCSSIRAAEAALAGRAALTFDALTESLTADERLVIVLRFLRKRTPSSIAKQLGLAHAGCANLLFRALSDVAERLGLDTDADPAQVHPVTAFVGDLVARRRPHRFEAAPAAWAALVAATHIQAAIAGNDLPGVRFVRSLEDMAEGYGCRARVTPLRI